METGDTFRKGKAMDNLIISFSGRKNGNCDQIGQYIASAGDGNDKVVRFRELNAHPCCGCEYECFGGVCKYREDDVYSLYGEMCRYDRVILIVPMYCGNPASLYFIFHERCQDYFSHNESRYEEVVKRLYIIGVYGKAETSPDFVPCLEKWFEGSGYSGRVLGIERHLYGQKMGDCVLDAAEVTEKIGQFLKQERSAACKEAEGK